MRVAIIVNFGFPGGMASTFRAKHLAMGLTEGGAEAEIIVPKPTEVNGHAINYQLSGRMDGFSYRYTSSSTIIPVNFIKRRIIIISGYFGCAKHLFQNRKEIDAVILYLREISGLAFLSLWCRLLGITAILELCEWPISHRNNSLRTRFQNWLLTISCFYFVDGVLAISSFLEQRTAEFSARHNLHRPCLVVPMLVKTDDYRCSRPYDPKGDLLFCGILDQTDIILFLLNVLSELRRRGAARTLTIIGKAFIEKNLEIIQQEIERLELSDLVTLAGYQPQNKIKEAYFGASILLAPLPSGERSIARFPNKIGEYLASGRPVVTTRIGDITKYLVDGVSAYLVDPDDEKGFVSAIEDIINNPGKACKIGQNGLQVAVKYFDPKDNGLKLVSFINNIHPREISSGS